MNKMTNTIHYRDSTEKELIEKKEKELSRNDWHYLDEFIDQDGVFSVKEIHDGKLKNYSIHLNTQFKENESQVIKDICIHLLGVFEKIDIESQGYIDICFNEFNFQLNKIDIKETLSSEYFREGFLVDFEKFLQLTNEMINFNKNSRHFRAKFGQSNYIDDRNNHINKQDAEKFSNNLVFKRLFDDIIASLDGNFDDEKINKKLILQNLALYAGILKDSRFDDDQRIDSNNIISEKLMSINKIYKNNKLENIFKIIISEIYKPENYKREKGDNRFLGDMKYDGSIKLIKNALGNEEFEKRFHHHIRDTSSHFKNNLLDILSK